MASPATSIEHWCLSTVHGTISQMTKNHRFSAIPGDSIQEVNKESVIIRLNRRPSNDERSQQAPERGIDLPGFIVTYRGHRRPVTAGENTVDDGVVEILVQLVDAGDDGDATNIASYMAWTAAIRFQLQGAPGSLSPLAQCPLSLGQVYMVHVSDMNPSDETDWAFSEHFRMALNVECFTRTPRKVER